MISDYIDNDTAETIQRLAALDVPNKLVGAYIDIATSDEFPTDRSLMDWLNDQCGTAYKPKHFSDWKNNHRPIPDGIASQMRREILQYLFADDASDTLMQVLALER